MPFFDIDPKTLSDADLATLQSELRTLQIAAFSEQSERSSLVDQAVAHMKEKGGDYASAVAAISAKKAEEEAVRLEAVEKIRAVNAPAP